MEKIHDSVAWYQQKIGSYDKQLWEQSVEQKVLKSIQQAPRRSVRPKTGLIDVDLVRGSTFTKAKPQVPWTYITFTTVSRVLLFPFHYKWWLQQMSFRFWVCLMVLYILQIFTSVMFFRNVGDDITQDELSLSEVVIPCVVMMLIGLIHSQTVLTHFSLKPPIRDNKRDGWRRNRSLSQRGSVTNADTTMTTGCDVTNSGSQSKRKERSQVQAGSRSARERTKDRKTRSKTNLNNGRQHMRRSNLNAGQAQDSESAYNTHEASDSYFDPSTSHEHDSNGLRHMQKGSDHLKVQHDAAAKLRESQESDLPESHGSNSEEDSKVKLRDKGAKNGCVEKNVEKRISQSISSEEEDVETLHGVTGSIGCEINKLVKDDLENDPAKTSQEFSRLEHIDRLNLKSEFEGVSKSEHENLGSTVRQLDRVNQELHGADRGLSLNSANLESHLKEKSDDNQQMMETLGVHSSFLDISYDSISPTFSSIDDLESTSNEALLPVMSESKSVDQNTDSLADDICKKVKDSKNRRNQAVHFIPGNDLVEEREITPLCSRDSTPTHTQSEIILPTTNMSTKRLRRLTSKSKSESDTETDDEAGSYQVRRRKGRGQELKESGSGGRRSSLSNPLRKSSTGVSSSEGETEAQASECGRRSVVSSEDWEDRIQSEDSTSFSSSCGSDPEISANEEPPQQSEGEGQGASVQGMTQSNIHVLNLLQPSTSQSVNTGTQDKVTCIIWEVNECKKVELTAMDIGWAIIDTVDKIPESSDYILIGIAFSIIMGLTPVLFHAFHTKDLPNIFVWENMLELVSATPWRQTLMVTNAIIQRTCLSAIFFFLLSVADRTFKQRLLYAKHFCYLTSSRRARKFDMPHFRLNKVRNIKTWLSLRSYLKKRGPQRSVDVIVSSSFLIFLLMLILMCLQLLRDAEIYLDYLCNWELLVWCMALGVYLLRFMTLGLRINKKYRNLSVLITEQINLYLQMEQKPHKKEELMVANNVLKLAECLLKELESPFKISGISANPFVLNVTKVVILSAFSAILTELLGFKLKLYKIKLKA